MRKVDASVVVFAAVSILYPLLAALAVRSFGPGWVLIGLFALLALRSALGLTSKVPGGLTYGLLVVAAGLAFVALFDRQLSVRLYPAFMNVAMLIAFGHTLIRPPSMIERFARLVEPNLPEHGVRYTRAVTWAWCIFFTVNAAIAAYTAAFATWQIWTIYNGVIAYVGMGLLFAGELLLRPFFRNAAETPR
jgi:uncharacterized membrane protein